MINQFENNNPVFLDGKTVLVSNPQAVMLAVQHPVFWTDLESGEVYGSGILSRGAPCGRSLAGR
jgi:hypothetical protein